MYSFYVFGNFVYRVKGCGASHWDGRTWICIHMYIYYATYQFCVWDPESGILCCLHSLLDRSWTKNKWGKDSLCKGQVFSILGIISFAFNKGAKNSMVDHFGTVSWMSLVLKFFCSVINAMSLLLCILSIELDESMYAHYKCTWVAAYHGFVQLLVFKLSCQWDNIEQVEKGYFI